MHRAIRRWPWALGCNRSGISAIGTSSSPGWSMAVKSATLEATSSNPRGCGWASSGAASHPESAEPLKAVSAPYGGAGAELGHC